MRKPAFPFLRPLAHIELSLSAKVAEGIDAIKRAPPSHGPLQPGRVVSWGEPAANGEKRFGTNFARL